MSARYITVNDHRYLIRGPATGAQLVAQFDAFCRKYGVPTGRHPFERWLRTQGKVYVRLPRRRARPRRAP